VRLYDVRAAVARWRCRHNLHWPIIWSESAYPGSWDPPEPPEPGWMCDSCGKTFEYGNYRLQARMWLTPLWWIEWRIRRQERAA
jgi:hypothetical protein